MLAVEAKFLTENGKQKGLNKVRPILKIIKNAVKNGEPDVLVGKLSDEQIDILESMGYGVLNHKSFNEYTGNHVVSWYCDSNEWL